MHCISGFIVKIENCPEAISLNNKYGIVEKEPKCDYVYISTDYFGGCGEQSAHVLINNKLNYPKSKYRQINEMLKLFGVIRTDEEDEFDICCLGKYRSNEELFCNETFTNALASVY